MPVEPLDVELGTAILDRLGTFANALRHAGIPVTQSEMLDAVEALAAIDLGQRWQVREALAAVSLSSASHRRVFETLFDVFFPARVGAGGQALTLEDAPDGGAGEDPTGAAQALLEELIERMLVDDRVGVHRLAHLAIDRFGRLPGAGSQGRDAGWFRYRVHRVLDAEALLAELLRRSSADGEPLSPLQQRLLEDELRARVQALMEEVDRELRRRAAVHRDPSVVARNAAPPMLEDLDVLHLSAQQQRDLRQRIRPLARRLAARTAVRRRRGRAGPLDVRRTVRRAMSTGGVPFDPSFRPRERHRPELFLLCDVSGSVATFARFTLQLVHAMQEEFSGVRSFAFVDALDEVSRFFDDDEVEDAVGRLMREADIVGTDGHSDYGRALTTFVDRYGHDVTARSTVVVLGDARTNYRHPGTQALDALQRRARRVWWLNPEPRTAWNTGDSVASSYVPFVEEMVEVRNIRQLAAFVERVA